MKFSFWKNILVVLFVISALMGGTSFILSHYARSGEAGQNQKNPFIEQAAAVVEAIDNSLELIDPVINLLPEPPLPPPPEKLSNPPEIIKAVYVTGWSAGSKKYLDYLSNLFNTTEINAVVIDIKDYSGFVSYDSSAEEVKKYNIYNRAISDIDSLVRFLHDKNIYVIGRISVFEDPVYSKIKPGLAVYNKAKTTDLANPVLWADNKGLSWLDPASKEVWDYNIALAKDVFLHGFDEVNFDYVRFPSDGDMKNMGFPVYDRKILKREVIKDFFQYVRQQLAGERISVDLFGLTTINKDDLGIGQVLEDALESFDYICPMVYPSHYATGFIGFTNPAEHPYEVIKYSMDNAFIKKEIFFGKQNQNYEVEGSPASESKLNLAIPLGKLRPWLQDFDMGAEYTAEMVNQQIKATQDSLGADYAGFMIWSPSNIYTLVQTY